MNIRKVLHGNVFGAMKLYTCRERCLVCMLQPSVVAGIAALSYGQLMNNEVVPAPLMCKSRELPSERRIAC